jgi:hypothetical protein
MLVISIFNTQQLKNKLLERISYISYASYLVHYPIIKLFNHYYKDDIYADIFAVIATFSLGYFLTYIYNKILHTYNNKFKLASILSLIFFSGGIYFITKYEVSQKYEPFNFQNIEDIQKEINSKLKHLKCSDGSYYDCYQTSKNENEILIIGDSHAMAIATGSLLNYSENKSEFKIISRGGCLPVVEYSFWNGDADTKPRECEKFYNIVRNEIKGKYKYIIFANYNSLFLNNWKAFEKEENNRAKRIDNKILYKKISERYVEIFKEIKSSGKIPIYIVDAPEFSTNLKDCEDDEKKCEFSRINVESSRPEELSIKYLLSTEFSFKSINLLDLICDDKDCYAYKDNEWRYADGNHLNAKWGGKAFDFIQLKIKDK